MSIDILGGYRLVRKLGEGARAEVFLGHPVRDDSPSPPVAIKVYRPSIPMSSILTESEALARAAGPHVVGIVDLAGDSHERPALLLQRLPGGSLARLLRERQRLGVGEAITVLAPLAAALSSMHTAGAVHGGVRADSILFASDGAPALACFGAARLIAPGLPTALLDSEAGVAADLQDFSLLARSVLALAGVDELPAALMATTRDGGWLERLHDELFELGNPVPVSFRTEPHESLPAPHRAVLSEPIAAERQRPAWAALLPEWADGIVERVRDMVAGVRRRVWIAAAGVGIALVGAVLLVPTVGSDATAQPTPAATLRPAPVVALGPVGGDDPIAAYLALLDARESCVRDLSVLCLDAVDQMGSAALSDDQALIRSLQDGTGSFEHVDVAVAQVTLVERLGDSALLSVAASADSEPASVLLMKGEAGWRIRDYLGG